MSTNPQVQFKEAQEASTAAEAALATAKTEISVLNKQVADGSDGLGLIAALKEDKSRLVEFEDKLPLKLKASVEGPEFAKHCEEWFGELDADKNGVLSAEELFPVIEHFLQDEEIEVTKSHVEEFTDVFDENGDGVIQREEFESYCRFQVIALYLHHHPDHQAVTTTRGEAMEAAANKARVYELEAAVEAAQDKVKETEESVKEHLDDKNRLAEDLAEAKAQHGALAEVEAAAAARHAAASELVVEKHAEAIDKHEQNAEETALRVANEIITLEKQLTDKHDDAIKKLGEEHAAVLGRQAGEHAEVLQRTENRVSTHSEGLKLVEQKHEMSSQEAAKLAKQLDVQRQLANQVCQRLYLW